MRIRAIVLISTLVVVAAGCGSGEPATPMSEAGTATTAVSKGPDLTGADFTDETGKDDVAVKVSDNVFIAQYTEVSPGAKVTFTNEGEQPHNVKPADEGAFAPIDTADMQPGDSGSISFDEPGDYSYYCSLHGTPTKGMTGTIRVLKE